MADPHDAIFEDYRVNTAVSTSDANWTTVTITEECFGFYIREKEGNKSFDFRESATDTDEFRVVAGDVIWIPIHLDAGATFQVKRVGDTDVTIQIITFR